MAGWHALSLSCDYREVDHCKVKSFPTLICYLLYPHDKYKPMGMLGLRKEGRQGPGAVFTLVGNTDFKVSLLHLENLSLFNIRLPVNNQPTSTVEKA